MEFRILGPLEVVAEPRPSLGGAKQRALLAYLLLHANEVVSRDRLIEALWGEQPPATAAHAIEVYVSRLRKLLGVDDNAAQLETRAPGYIFELEPDRLDARLFERLRSEGKQALDDGDAAVAAANLREALALWRGPALSDFTYEPFAQEEIARLEELRLATLEERIEADLALARHAELVPELERIVADHPLRERPRAQLMLALYRAGRQADALAVFRDTSRLLRAELGLEPAPLLRDLEAAILRQDPGLAVEAPELRSRRHLPAPTTAFVGRGDQIQELVELLRGDVRLLTLTGPGGIGKTRLGIEVATRLADRFADGVFFVDLASTTDDELLAPTIAHALGLREAGGTPPLEVLARHVRERRLLLVLDNFEQITAAAPLIGELLRASEGSKVLVTSRSPLRVYGEFEYHVPPLSLADPVDRAPDQPNASEAAALFAVRARAVRRGFELTTRNMGAVHELCSRLDGLPLALELAAARSRELPPERMLDTLQQRLELASEGPRDVPVRQQTLRATLEWSHGLLDEAEQSLFARLAVFAGGWTLAAAAVIAGADEPSLRALADKSLVVETARNGESRFTMLETIREYAAERLSARADAGELRQHHADYFRGMAEQTEDELGHAIDDPEPLDRLETEHDNLRTAVDWLQAAGEPEPALRLATALKLFWWVRGYLSEGRRSLEAALELGVEQQSPLRAKALAAAGVLAYKQADYTRAKDLWEQSLGLYRSLGDAEGIAGALAELGGVAVAEGDYDRATALYEESRDLYREIQEPISLATVLSNLGDIALNRGDYEAAAHLCEEALALQRQLPDKEGPAISLFNLSRASLHRGRGAEAAAYLGESLELADAIGHRELIGYCLAALAGVAAPSGERAERAARIGGAGEAVFDAMGLVPQAHERELYEQTVAQLRARLGEQALTHARSEGRELDVDQAVEAALELAREVAGEPA